MPVISIKTELAGADQVIQGLGSIGIAATKTGEAVKSAGKSFADFGSGMSQLGGRLSLYIGAPLALLSQQVVRFANEAMTSQRQFDASFGSMGHEAERFVSSLHTSIGASESDTRRFMASINTLGQTMGLTRQASLQMAEGITRLSYDFSAFFNISPAEAFQILQGGIVGAGRELRRMGVDVSDARVKQELFAAGLIKSGQELSSQQAELGRYIVILKQTTQEQGAMAGALDTPAVRMRALKSEVIDLAERIGAAMMPAIGALVGVIQGLLPVLTAKLAAWERLDPAMKGATLSLIGFGIAVGPFVKTLGLVIEGLAGVYKGLALLTVAQLSAASLVTLGVAFLLAIRYSRDFAQSVHDTSVEIGAQIGPIGALVGKLLEYAAASNAVTKIKGGVNVPDPLHLDTDWLKRQADTAVGIMTKMGQDAAKGTEINTEAIKKWYADAVEAAKGAFKTLPGVVKDTSKEAADAARQFLEEYNRWTNERFQLDKELHTRSIADLRDDLQQRLAGVAGYAAEYDRLMQENAHFLDGSGKITTQQMSKELQQRLQFLQGYSTESKRLLMEIADLDQAEAEQTTAQYIAGLNSRVAALQAMVSSGTLTKRQQIENEKQIQQEQQETIFRLEILREKYVQLGAEGTKAVEAIDRAMQGVATQTEKTDNKTQQLLEQIGINTSSLAQLMTQAFQGFFQSVVQGTTNMGDVMLQVISALVNGILAQFAQIAANQVFQWLISHDSSAGGGFSFGSFEDLIPSFDIFSGGGLGDIFGGFGSFLGFQGGTDRIVGKPELIRVGEHGKERVTVTPIGGMGGNVGGGVTVVLGGPVVMNDLQLARLSRSIGNEVARSRRLV